MKKIRREKRSLVTYIVPTLGAIAIAGMCLPTGAVSAAGNSNEKANMTVMELSSSDPYANDTIKTYAIESIAEKNDDINYEDIDIDNSIVSVSGLNLNKPGIQAVTLSVSLAKVDDTAKSVGYTYTETAAINVIKSSNPVIKLKKESVTVNNGDAWNPSSYISTITDDSGILPVLKVSDNVDMNTDGDYYASFTAIDTEGNSSTTVLNVTVKTPQEVIDAREAEEEAAATAAAKKAEEEAAATAAARAAANAAAIAAGDGTVTPGRTYGMSSLNPYPYGWSNCTYGAWEATYESLGIAMPNMGNAYEWLYRAQGLGYNTGSVPVVGSVVVYTHHVAFVDAVSADGSAVHIVEGGYEGHYMERWVSPTNDGIQGVQGYIYFN